MTVPPAAWLDVGLGTVDEGAVTFKVAAQGAGQSGEPAVLLEQTLTTPYRWESRAIDLAQFSGREVTLTLSVAAAESGAIGLWGAPVVRRRTRPRLRPAAGVSPALTQAPQGVIVIWADTLRADHLDAYGYDRETAPTLKQFARDGVLFQNNTTQATWTKVATPSMATSLYPSTHGVVNFNDRLPATATTLAEVYRAAGYATVGFASNLFTGQFTNLHQGFEEQHEDGSLPNQGSSKTARGIRRFDWRAGSNRIATIRSSRSCTSTIPDDPFEPGRPYDSMWADPAKRDEHFRTSKPSAKSSPIL